MVDFGTDGRQERNVPLDVESSRGGILGMMLS